MYPMHSGRTMKDRCLHSNNPHISSPFSCFVLRYYLATSTVVPEHSQLWARYSNGLFAKRERFFWSRNWANMNILTASWSQSWEGEVHFQLRAVKKTSWERESFGQGLWDSHDLHLGRMTGKQEVRLKTMPHRWGSKTPRCQSFPEVTK